MNRLVHVLVITFAMLAMCACLPAASQSPGGNLPEQNSLGQVAGPTDAAHSDSDVTASRTPFTELNGLFALSFPENWQTNGVAVGYAEHLSPLYTAGATTIAWSFAGLAGGVSGQISVARWLGAIEDGEDLEAWSRQRAADVATERVDTIESQLAGLDAVAYTNHYPEINHTLMQTDVRCGDRVWLVAYGYTGTHNEELVSIYNKTVESFRPVCPTPAESIVEMAPYHDAYGLFAIDFPSGWLVGDTPSVQDWNASGRWQFMRDYTDGSQSIEVGLHLATIAEGESLEEWSTDRSQGEMQSEVLVAEGGVVNGMERFTLITQLAGIDRVNMQTELRCGARVWFLSSHSTVAQYETHRTAFEEVVEEFHPVCPILARGAATVQSQSSVPEEGQIVNTRYRIAKPITRH